MKRRGSLLDVDSPLAPVAALRDFAREPPGDARLPAVHTGSTKITGIERSGDERGSYEPDVVLVVFVV